MMFTGESIRLNLLEPEIAELTFDRQGDSINKLDVRTIEELRAATAELRARRDVRGLLVTSAKPVFIVGADIFEFSGLFARPEEQIAAHIGAQSEVFRSFEDLDMPVVTAINGVAFGGGLEMALASDYRVAARTAQLGLPEVKLGLFPGYGGTVRLPRLAGSTVAIDWITTGRARSAGESAADHVIDAVVEPESLRAAALEHLKTALASGAWRERRVARHGPFSLDTQAVEKARARLQGSAAREPAALTALELLVACAAMDRDTALRQESLAFGRIARTQAAASLVQLFVNEQRVKGKAKAHARRARPVRRVGVVGAGIMGGGIAYSSAMSGAQVLLQDIAPKALEQGVAEARKQLDKQVRNARLTEQRAAQVLSAIRPQADYARFEELDLVIEAVVENLRIKRGVLAAVEQSTGAAAIVATNTSSLSLVDLGEDLRRPENFLGMHFFNPVPVMPLVEIVRGPDSAPQTVDSAVGFATALGKTPIVVRDCPGFLVNRILTAYLLGYYFALRDGADLHETDRIMEQFGWPMGPAYLQDVIGLDTMLHVIEVIAAGYPQRMAYGFALPLEQLLKHNRLGQKSGAGYYRYAADPKGKPAKLADPQITALLPPLRADGARSLSDQETVERLMLPMMIEAALCLEEGVADSPEEIDLALVLGLGFPRYAGGPLKYADWLGLPHVVERCDAYAALGALYRPTQRMRDMARRGEHYFSGENRQ
jgi:3-hydroxyacyl-CoA dehydrogenase/enoyl-CoA hydratase/3-hydroxybutyryl-CoA epimerase/enoyl-CoA isomerase